MLFVSRSSVWRSKHAHLTLGKLTDRDASRHRLCFEAGEMIAAVCVQVHEEKENCWNSQQEKS
jgi:hypothetical protein